MHCIASLRITNFCHIKENDSKLLILRVSSLASLCQSNRKASREASINSTVYFPAPEILSRFPKTAFNNHLHLNLFHPVMHRIDLIPSENRDKHLTRNSRSVKMPRKALARQREEIIQLEVLFRSSSSFRSSRAVATSVDC